MHSEKKKHLKKESFGAKLYSSEVYFVPNKPNDIAS